MSADQKKSMVKMYLILSIICFIVIVTLYLIEAFLIHPSITPGNSNPLWFSYISSIVYGIFTGLLTGLAISFYEYRQQIYLDFYTYIKNTRECVTITQKMLLQKNYDLCLFQIEQYNDSVKDTFIIRKLRKNNAEIHNTIESIKKAMSDINISITQINNTSNIVAMHTKQANDLPNVFMLSFDPDMPDNQLKFSLLEIRESQKKIEAKIKNATDANQIFINQCSQKLKEVEALYISLYNHINKARSIFLL